MSLAHLLLKVMPSHLSLFSAPSSEMCMWHFCQGENCHANVYALVEGHVWTYKTFYFFHSFFLITMFTGILDGAQFFTIFVFHPLLYHHYQIVESCNFILRLFSSVHQFHAILQETIHGTSGSHDMLLIRSHGEIEISLCVMYQNKQLTTRNQRVMVFT